MLVSQHNSPAVNKGNTIIQVRNLVKQYGSLYAVNDISFDVYEGEIFGLLGPNGAGKSTTLEIIETLREKTSGEVNVNGLDLDKSPDEIKKIIGVQLQARSEERRVGKECRSGWWEYDQRKK